MSEPGELDIYLFGEGRHRRLWDVLGPQRLVDGSHGFSVWAPQASAVGVVGDWNYWSDGVDELDRIGESGLWWGEVDNAREGQAYKLAITTSQGSRELRADPMARAAEVPPATASVIPWSHHRWRSGDWRAERTDRNSGRMSIYEVHLGSWRFDNDGRPLGYREIAGPLAEYVSSLGFTHVELMPVATHPYGGSWGYQVTGYYAPDARGGSTDDLRYLVDVMHSAGLGVIADWVPAHFPRDSWALARFDGTCLYEHADAKRGEHPDWGTYVFDHGRGEVRSFLIANACYWLEEFRVDGLRVDAVASMLYLDYSRDPGEWEPNIHGGREDLEAVTFVRELNTAVHEEHPGALMIAEESTAWPGVTTPVKAGGLGFDRKWNLGWMHDSLTYFARDPIHRSHHHSELTFPMHYAFDESWVLPLSHDEVVHGKGSLLTKMPGDRWQSLANLRCLLAWQWAMPGAPLIFMGAELGQFREWADDRELDWWLADDPDHAGLSRLITRLNELAAGDQSLWSTDHDRGSVWWLDAGDANSSVVSLVRRGGPDSLVIVAANLTPVPRHGYRLGVPVGGEWVEALTTDHLSFGGTGSLNESLVVDLATPWQGQPASLLSTLGPLSVTFFARRDSVASPVS